MKVTVCQLHDERKLFSDDWDGLVAHVRDQQSTLVLLPEMAFCAWPFSKRVFDNNTWRAAVRAHDEWEERLHELAPAIVLGSRPIDFGNERYNEGFVWDSKDGLRSVHAKSWVTDQERNWERSWYNSATAEFQPMAIDLVDGSASLSIGFLIGMELWLTDQAQLYGMENVQVLATPRATGSDTSGWLEVGRNVAAAAQAYGLSSNRMGANRFDGQSWIISPHGEVLAITNDQNPFQSVFLDLGEVDHAHAQPQRTSVSDSQPGA